MATKDRSRRRVPSFRDRQRFPESSSPYQQLRLLLAGSMPLIRHKCASALYRLRSALAAAAARLRRVTEPKRFHVAVFLSASVAVAVFAVFNVLYTTATTVSLNGVELGTVASEEEAAAARMSVEASISDVLGYDYTLEESAVSYSTGLTARSAVEDAGELEKALEDELNMVAHGYALYVGGEFIGATQTEGALEELLEQVAAPFRNENTVSIDFVEDIEIRECDLPVEDFTNLADVARVLDGVDHARAHAGTASHVVVEAGPAALGEHHVGDGRLGGVALEQALGALPLRAGGHADGDHLAEGVDGLARGAGVGVGAKVAGALSVLLARVLDGGKDVRLRDGNEGVALVVLVVHVEVRVVLGDEVSLQHERLVLGAHDHIVKVAHHLHHERDLLAVVLQRHVLAHAGAQVLGLADVDHLALGVLPEVAAGLGGDLCDALGDRGQVVTGPGAGGSLHPGRAGAVCLGGRHDGP